MSNFKDMILKEAGKEQIDAIIIGNFGWCISGEAHEISKSVAKNMRGRILQWDVAKLMLDFEYDCGFGAPETFAILAWTKSRVIFITEYDGSTTVNSVPRNPIKCMPEMF